MNNLKGTLLAPDKPLNIEKEAQWLSGQGGGVWFHIKETTEKNKFIIKRYAPNGDLDCERIFNQEQNGTIFDINQPYQFTHISHCTKCRIIQNKITYTFNYL